MSNPDPNPVLANNGEPPPPIEAEIFVYVDELCVAKYSLTQGDYLIGRDKSCQIPIEIDGVSRHHARLGFQGYELVLEDMDSANGVFIDGVKIQLPTRVRREQQVEMGSARLCIRLKDKCAAMFAEALWDPDLGLTPVRTLLEGKKYTIHSPIGRGGMGVVHKARDLRVRRTVAIKSMKMANQFSREYVLRFIEEAQVTGQLQHPNIVPVYELGLDEQGEVFYTMKYIRGTTLEDVLTGLRRGDPERLKTTNLPGLLTIFQKICDAVAFAHSKGVVHRDLKPDNIMVGEYGEVLVMDWGLAKRFVHLSEEENDESHDIRFDQMEYMSSIKQDARAFQTMNGLVVGSPPYISPEAARGELNQVNHRSDIYVLGSLLYAILTLRPPYPGREFAELVTQIADGKFDHPSSFNIPAKKKKKRGQGAKPPEETYDLAHLPGKRVPDGLSAIVLKAMHLDPKQRYQRVEELQADITAWQGGFAPKAEHASFFKHFLLWAARHKRSVILFAIFAIVFHLSVGSLFYSLMSERDRAKESGMVAIQNQQALDAVITELKGAAPIFAEEAHRMILLQRLDEALENIELAIAQVPNNADYYVLKANILETMLRWDEAIAAYKAALDRNSELQIASDNAAFLKQLQSRSENDSEPTRKQLEDLADRMQDQRRPAEATMLRAKTGTDSTPASFGKMFQTAANESPAFSELLQRRAIRSRFRKLKDDTYGADLRNLPIAPTMALLNAKPDKLSSLYLDKSSISDLSPLKGFSLRHLSIADCRKVSDLSPIQGMPLERLNLSETGVSDLAVLADMPIRVLFLADCNELTSIEPLLACENLETLVIPRTVQDVARLKELSGLKMIGFRNPPIPAAQFWKEYETEKLK